MAGNPAIAHNGSHHRDLVLKREVAAVHVICNLFHSTKLVTAKNRLNRIFH